MSGVRSPGAKSCRFAITESFRFWVSKAYFLSAIAPFAQQVWKSLLFSKEVTSVCRGRLKEHKRKGEKKKEEEMKRREMERRRKKEPKRDKREKGKGIRGKGKRKRKRRRIWGERK